MKLLNVTRSYMKLPALNHIKPQARRLFENTTVRKTAKSLAIGLSIWAVPQLTMDPATFSPALPLALYIGAGAGFGKVNGHSLRLTGATLLVSRLATVFLFPIYCLLAARAESRRVNVRV